MSTPPPVSSILIIGSGVFGLSTAYSLAKNPRYKDTTITVVDRHSFPSQDSSSIDNSRIIRPDYADPAYSALAYVAQELWRSTHWGADGRYHETGLCLTANAGGAKYVDESLRNVRALEAARLESSRPDAGATEQETVTRVESRGYGRPTIEVLRTDDEVRRAAGTGGTNGCVGYVNWTSGWADAEACMRYLHSLVRATGRVRFVTATVSRLLVEHGSAGKKVSGALLADGASITADLTVLAAGAWTPALLDLRGMVSATGQTVCYISISDAEQAALKRSPTVLNLSTGMFVIPPGNSGLLKLARHGHGYANPVTIPHPESADPSATMTVSVPRTHLTTPALPPDHLPAEATAALRALAADLFPPGLAPHDKTHSPLPIALRPFAATRLCYYADTPTGDFLLAYHPAYAATRSLFVATGGSGHAFKFLPVIGDRIVDCLDGRTPAAFRRRWAWSLERRPEAEWDGDGSRGGPRGMVLDREYAMGSRL